MPLRNFNSGGTRPTGRLRVRNRWFRGAVIEEETEHRTGEITWERCEFPTVIRERDRMGFDFACHHPPPRPKLY